MNEYLGRKRQEQIHHAEDRHTGAAADKPDLRHEGVQEDADSDTQNEDAVDYGKQLLEFFSLIKKGERTVATLVAAVHFVIGYFLSAVIALFHSFITQSIFYHYIRAFATKIILFRYYVEFPCEYL